MADPARPPGADEGLKRIRVVGLCAICYALMFSYSLARPTVESLFIEAHGARSLPLVGVLVSLAMLAAVAVYNRFVARVELLRLFSIVALLSAALLAALLPLRTLALPGIHHAIFVWKEIYMVVLVEIFYTFANSVFAIATARWVYGLFGTLGGLGAVSGNLLVRELAPAIGTVQTLALALPVLGLLGVGGYLFGRLAGLSGTSADGPRQPSLLHAARVTRRSSYLLLVVALIFLVQCVVTLVDFSFNVVTEQAYPVTDQRTAVVSTVYAAVSVAMLLLHALTGPVLRLLGVPLTLLSIPVLLGSGVGAFALLPTFATVSVVKVASKALDYTLLRNAKELLYIPLSFDERTQGKAVVDMLGYRVAKGAASALLAALLALKLATLVEPTTLALAAAWFAVTIVVVRRFRQKVSREEEMAG